MSPNRSFFFSFVFSSEAAMKNLMVLLNKLMDALHSSQQARRSSLLQLSQ